MALVSEPRVVVVHFHLFKNAGTSVERGLHAHFGSHWSSFDKDSSAARLSDQDLVAFLTNRSDIAAVSSHQLRPPLRADARFEYLPIVFLRHPLDRIRSAYEFERHQGPVSPSSRVAAEATLVEWIGFHRNRASAQCSNFQTVALSSLRSESGAPSKDIPLEQHVDSAMKFLAALPVVGVVESYDRSWALISDWIRRYHDDFASSPTHVNATIGATKTLEERLTGLRVEVGNTEFERLVAENSGDLQLHSWACQRLGHSP